MPDGTLLVLADPGAHLREVQESTLRSFGRSRGDGVAPDCAGVFHGTLISRGRSTRPLRHLQPIAGLEPWHLCIEGLTRRWR